MNADKVCFGRLKVQVSLELVSKPSSNKRPGGGGSEPMESTKQPEFVVGPGVSATPTTERRRGNTLGPSQPQKDHDIDAVIGYLKERDGGNTEQGREEDTRGVLHVASERGGGKIEPTSVLRSGDGVGGEIGNQQVEVISELIERGKKLRDAMLHSMLEPSTVVAAARLPVTSELTRLEDSTR